MPGFRIEVAKRFAAYNAQVGAAQDAPVPAQVRAAIRTQVGRETFRATYGRDPVDARELAGLIAKVSRPQTTAVAGYDLTFSPVKSVSTLWALADPATATVIERMPYDPRPAPYERHLGRAARSHSRGTPSADRTQHAEHGNALPTRRHRK